MYGSASEVIREALRLFEAYEQIKTTKLDSLRHVYGLFGNLITRRFDRVDQSFQFDVRLRVQSGEFSRQINAYSIYASAFSSRLTHEVQVMPLILSCCSVLGSVMGWGVEQLLRRINICKCRFIRKRHYRQTLAGLPVLYLAFALGKRVGQMSGQAAPT